MTKILLLALTLSSILLAITVFMHGGKMPGEMDPPVAQIKTPEQPKTNSNADLTRKLLDERPPAETDPIINAFEAPPAIPRAAYRPNETPKSERSKAVIERLENKLHREFSEMGLRFGNPIFIRILKQEKRLELWVQNNTVFTLFKTYPIATLAGDLGPKTSEGDGQCPEGFYYVPSSRLNPNSQYHLAFNIGYPNTYDTLLDRTGSAIMVHGGQSSTGCFAMTDPVIEEVYTIVDAALSGGQSFFRIHIFPFYMTAANMSRYSSSPHADFWANLKQGYDFFEQRKKPPNVNTRNGRYVFN